MRLLGPNSTWPPSDGEGRYCMPSQNRIAAPRPGPAERPAALPPSFLPLFKNFTSFQKRSDDRLDAVIILTGERLPGKAAEASTGNVEEPEAGPGASDIACQGHKCFFLSIYRSKIKFSAPS